MTTSTHSHKAWTDKGGHVKEADVPLLCGHPSPYGLRFDSPAMLSNVCEVAQGSARFWTSGSGQRPQKTAS